MLSRRIDRARMAYGRCQWKRRGSASSSGTTNKGEYLPDTTGNRRFWPVRIQTFDLDALRRDRDQLWAEAAARETQGESIRLARELWPEAAKNKSSAWPMTRSLRCFAATSGSSKAGSERAMCGKS